LHLATEIVCENTTGHYLYFIHRGFVVYVCAGVGDYFAKSILRLKRYCSPIGFDGCQLASKI